MKELTYYLSRFHQFTGKILFINLLGMILVSLLDGAAMLLLIPMFNISGILEIGNPDSSYWGFLNFLRDYPKEMGLTMILVIYLSMVIGQSLLERNLAIRDVKIKQGFMNKLKEDTYESLFN